MGTVAIAVLLLFFNEQTEIEHEREFLQCNLSRRHLPMWHEPRNQAMQRSMSVYASREKFAYVLY